MQTAETIFELLNKAMATKQYWVIGKAIHTLWQYQTASEQATQSTHLHNNVGFNGADAKWLSIMGEWYDKHPKVFTEKQALKSFPRLKKYCGQLAKIANSKQQAA